MARWWPCWPSTSRKVGQHDVRLLAADDGDEAGERAFFAPAGESLLGRLREAEVDDAVAVGVAEPIEVAAEARRRPLHLGRSDHAEVGAALAPEDVLAALAARRTGIGDADAVPEREQSEQAGHLVVGMRTRRAGTDDGASGRSAASSGQPDVTCSSRARRSSRRATASGNLRSVRLTLRLRHRTPPLTALPVSEDAHGEVVPAVSDLRSDTAQVFRLSFRRISTLALRFVL